MAKRSKEGKKALADWEVRADLGGTPQALDFPGTYWKCSKRGFHTFRDSEGIVAEFTPGVVLSIRRKEPPVVVHPPGFEDETRQSGYERTLAAEAARTVLAAKRHNGER